MLIRTSMRTALRHRLLLPGSELGDFLVQACCPPCGLMQEAREMECADLYNQGLSEDQTVLELSDVEGQNVCCQPRAAETVPEENEKDDTVSMGTLQRQRLMLLLSVVGFVVLSSWRLESVEWGLQAL